MAFGTQLGFKTGSATSISTALSIATGTSFAVAANDLIYVVVAEQVASGNGTCTVCNDNLGNLYTQTAAQLGSGTVACKAWYSRVTKPGTITTVTVTANGGTSNGCGIAVGIGGPFNAIDKNPANITSDVTSRFTCPSTGTLTFANEVIVAWGGANYGTTWTAFAPNIIVTNAVTSTLAKCAIGIQTVAVTTAVAPEFAAAADPSNAVLGTTSFSAADTTTQLRAAHFTAPSLYRPPYPTQLLGWTQSPAVPPVTAANPFYQTDWPLPQRAPSRPDWIYSTPINLIGKDVYPFRQLDWPVPQRLAVTPQGWIWPKTRDAPFRQTDWPVPLRPAVTPQGWTQSPAQPVTTAPFAQYDWPVPQRLPLLRPGFIDFDRYLIQVALPFNQYDWPVPLRPAVTPQGWTQSPAQPTQVVTAAPFAQYDWPTPRAQPQQPLGFTQPKTRDAPFRQTSWPVPQQLAQQPAGWINQAIREAVAVSLPFNQYDWPVPQSPRQPTTFGWSQSPAVPAGAKPFAQYAWPVPQTPPLPPPFNPPNLALFFAPPPAPITELHYRRFGPGMGTMGGFSDI